MRDRDRSWKSDAYLDGEGLMEVFEETMGLELIEVAPFSTLGLIELLELVHELPHLLSLAAKLLFCNLFIYLC